MGKKTPLTKNTKKVALLLCHNHLTISKPYEYQDQMVDEEEMTPSLLAKMKWKKVNITSFNSDSFKKVISNIDK